jgi:hypothetical protein
MTGLASDLHFVFVVLGLLLVGSWVLGILTALPFLLLGTAWVALMLWASGYIMMACVLITPVSLPVYYYTQYKRTGQWWWSMGPKPTWDDYITQWVMLPIGWLFFSYLAIFVLIPYLIGKGVG